MTRSQTPAGTDDRGRRDTDEASEAFRELVDTMDRLRSPGGCPWDGEQTHASLVRYLIEEAYEVVEAIESPGGVDRTLLREELGDVLLQVVFHARVAEEVPAAEGGFGILDVVRGLNDKLVRRHPHVFEDLSEPSEAGGDEEQMGDEELEALTRRWDEIKRVEKPERTDPFDGIPPALPALALAEKTLNKAAKANLPLPDAGTEASGRRLPRREVSPESVAPGTAEAAEAQVGADLLDTVVRARQLGVDPEKALRRAVREFIDSSRGNA